MSAYCVVMSGPLATSKAFNDAERAPVISSGFPETLLSAHTASAVVHAPPMTARTASTTTDEPVAPLREIVCDHSGRTPSASAKSALKSR